MWHRSPARRRGGLAGLTSPALLLFLVQSSGCGGRPDPATALALEFPEQAPSVLGAGQGFVPSAAGFAGAGAERVHVDLPWDGGGDIVLRGPGGFEAHVREVGAVGAAKLVDHAVAYRRDGGAAFWTTTPGGVEEWIHLAPGRAGSAPAAVWQVEGARVRARGEVVELLGADGGVRVLVTAPVAYAASGRRIDVHLRAGAGGIELFADAGGEAALIDPKWKVVASLSAPRADHKAALVGSGKVLVAGGTDGSSISLDTASLYDPAADAWKDVTPMSASHICHTATALTDGTVVVVGGLDQFANPEATTDVYDETQGFTNVSDMQQSRMNHAADRLANGHVLVTGGLAGFEAEAAFTRHPSPPRWIIPKGVGCRSFGGGSGSGGPGATNSAEIYDPMTQSWTEAASMVNARERHTETLLADGTVVVTGGMNYGNVQSSFEIYTPSSDSWNEPEASIGTPRADHTATLLPSGDLLLVGGTSGFGSVLDSATILPMGGGGGSSGVDTPPMSTPRTLHTATLLSDGTVLVAGGNDGNVSLATAEIYDPVGKTWSLAATMTSARSDHSATALMNGDVLVAGGIDDTMSVIPEAELYVNLLVTGAPCATSDQCQSTFCTQGVCCEAACDAAPCQACAMVSGATADGTCTSVPGSCNESLCKVSGVCTAGACVGAVTKPCPAADDCHLQGTCDPGTGNCSTVAKLDGSMCSVGICIAGACVPDPSLGTGGSTTTTTTTGTTTTTTGTTTTTTGTTTTPEGTGGTGGVSNEQARLSGDGCSTGGLPSGPAPAGLLAALLAMLGLSRWGRPPNPRPGRSRSRGGRPPNPRRQGRR